MPTKYPLREDPSCSMVKWKRINSQKIEFATHNSFEKGLKESIAQPSTPEVLADLIFDDAACYSQLEDGAG